MTTQPRYTAIKITGEGHVDVSGNYIHGFDVGVDADHRGSLTVAENTLSAPAPQQEPNNEHNSSHNATSDGGVGSRWVRPITITVVGGLIVAVAAAALLGGAQPF